MAKLGFAKRLDRTRTAETVGRTNVRNDMCRNRAGQAPNIAVVHTSLYQSICRDGFDKRRPHPGFAIQMESTEMIAANIAFNKKLADGTDTYPPLVVSHMTRATLAGSHLTLLLRCLRSGMKSSLLGTSFTINDDDDDLKKVVADGHCYWLLSEKITEEDAVLLSEWRNSDQNQNQFNSEMQLIKNIQRICLKEQSLANGQVKLATVVQKVCG